VAHGEGLTIKGSWRRFLRGFWRWEAALVAGDMKNGDGVFGDATCIIGGAGGVVHRRIEEGRASVAFVSRKRMKWGAAQARM
jgi:hypothetical protein